jgi:hypothetical protein
MLLTIATRLGDMHKDIDTPDALRAADGYYQKARKVNVIITNQ